MTTQYPENSLTHPRSLPAIHQNFSHETETALTHSSFFPSGNPHHSPFAFNMVETRLDIISNGSPLRHQGNNKDSTTMADITTTT
jgi:hypothetical protein